MQECRSGWHKISETILEDNLRCGIDDAKYIRLLETFLVESLRRGIDDAKVSL